MEDLDLDLSFLKEVNLDLELDLIIDGFGFEDFKSKIHLFQNSNWHVRLDYSPPIFQIRICGFGFEPGPGFGFGFDNFGKAQIWIWI